MVLGPSLPIHHPQVWTPCCDSSPRPLRAGGRDMRNSLKFVNCSDPTHSLMGYVSIQTVIACNQENEMFEWVHENLSWNKKGCWIKCSSRILFFFGENEDLVFDWHDTAQAYNTLIFRGWHAILYMHTYIYICVCLYNIIYYINRYEL